MDEIERENARDVGRRAVDTVRHSVRDTLRHRLAALVRSDPDVMARAVELGVVSREWLRDPAGEPIAAAPPREVLARFLSREVERRPSLLSELGLSALQILTSGDDDGEVRTARTVAIVFTDLVGFTAFTARDGDDAAHDLLQRHARTVGPVVRSRGGSVVKRMGDGVLATFPSPEAAVLAALELVAHPPEPLALRAGVHWGDAHATRDDVVGHAVNVAARVCDAARTGEVLVTVETRDAARDARGVEFGRVGRRKVKGLDEPLRVCRAGRLGSPTLEMAVVPRDG